MDLLDIQLQVNGKLVSPLDLSWSMPDSSAEQPVISPQIDVNDRQPFSVMRGGGYQDPTIQDSRMQVSSVKKERNTEGLAMIRTGAEAASATTGNADTNAHEYHAVSIGELVSHIGRKTLIDTHNGRRVEGRLQRVKGQTLYIQYKKLGGVALLPIRFDRIDTVKVML
jgi:hypothetical protein